MKKIIFKDILLLRRFLRRTHLLSANFYLLGVNVNGRPEVMVLVNENYKLCGYSYLVLVNTTLNFICYGYTK